MGFGGRCWELHSDKDLSKNDAKKGLHLGFDFLLIFLDWGSQVNLFGASLGPLGGFLGASCPSLSGVKRRANSEALLETPQASSKSLFRG